MMPQSTPSDHRGKSQTNGRLVSDPLFDTFISEHIVPLVVDYEDGFETLGEEIESSFQPFMHQVSSKWHASCYNVMGWIETVGLTLVALLGLAIAVLTPHPPPTNPDLLSDDTSDYNAQFSVKNGRSFHERFRIADIRNGLALGMLLLLIVHMAMAWLLYLRRRHVGRHFECMNGHKEAVMLVPWILEGFNLPNPLLITRVVPSTMTHLFGPVTVIDEDQSFLTVCPQRLRHSRVMYLILPYFVAAVWLTSILNQSVAVHMYLFGPVIGFALARIEVIRSRLSPYNYRMFEHLKVDEGATDLDELETVHVNHPTAPSTAWGPNEMEDEEEEQFDLYFGGETLHDEKDSEEHDETDESDGGGADGHEDSLRNYIQNRQTYDEHFGLVTEHNDLSASDWDAVGVCETMMEYRGMICLDIFMLCSVYPLLLMLPFTMSMGLLCELHVMWNHAFAFQYFVHYWYLFLGVKIAFGTLISTAFHCFSPSDWIGPRDVFYAISFWSLSFSSALIFMAQFFGSESAISYTLRCFLWIVFYVWSKCFGLMRIQGNVGRRDLSMKVLTRLLCWFQTSVLDMYNIEE